MLESHDLSKSVIDHKSDKMSKMTLTFYDLYSVIHLPTSNRSEQGRVIRGHSFYNDTRLQIYLKGI